MRNNCDTIYQPCLSTRDSLPTVSIIVRQYIYRAKQYINSVYQCEII